VHSEKQLSQYQRYLSQNLRKDLIAYYDAVTKNSDVIDQTIESGEMSRFNLIVLEHEFSTLYEISNRVLHMQNYIFENEKGLNTDTSQFKSTFANYFRGVRRAKEKESNGQWVDIKLSELGINKYMGIKSVLNEWEAIIKEHDVNDHRLYLDGLLERTFWRDINYEIAEVASKHKNIRIYLDEEDMDLGYDLDYDYSSYVDQDRVTSIDKDIDWIDFTVDDIDSITVREYSKGYVQQPCLHIDQIEGFGRSTIQVFWIVL